MCYLPLAHSEEGVVSGRPGAAGSHPTAWSHPGVDRALDLGPEALLRSDPQAKKLLAEFNNVPMSPMLRALTLKPDGTPDTEAIRVKAEAIRLPGRQRCRDQGRWRRQAGGQEAGRIGCRDGERAARPGG